MELFPGRAQDDVVAGAVGPDLRETLRCSLEDDPLLPVTDARGRTRRRIVRFPSPVAVGFLIQNS